MTSTVNKGSCFRIGIPRVSKSDLPANTTNLVKGTTNPEESIQSKILLIDNDTLMLTALAKQLTEWGCQVVTAKDKNSAREQFTGDNFDGVPPSLIIADYHLEDGENGVDVAQQLIKSQQWQSPCIICSADPSETVRQHTSDAKFNFVRKPIKALALKRLVRQLISR